MAHIRFTAEELDLFSHASHDRNPLHMSDDYTQRTPYGGRVVFGVLNALTALGQSHLRRHPGRALSSIECEFFDVALLGIDYSVSTSEGPAQQATVRVMDGRRPLLEMILTFRSGEPEPFERRQEFSASSLPCRDLQGADLTVGYRTSGRYAACEPDLSVLCAHAGLHETWAKDRAVSALLWASYLIGMELPGKRALFSRLRIDFVPSASPSSPFDYQAEIQAISEVGELGIEASLSSGGKVWAKAQLGAHIREDLPSANTATIERMVGRSEALAGTVALVTGGSRGLGAALVRALALHGSTVVLNFVKRQVEAENVRDSLLQTPGTIVLEQGDVANLTWCLELQQRVKATLKRLDFLFCNASPPLLPLWLEPSSAARVNQFVNRSLAMVTTPMAALLPVLSETKGWNVLISSTAVSQIHPYFPHYAAAKAGAEAMVKAASAEYRTISSLIARPARLLTDLTNTPLGRRGAIAPECVAATIVRRLIGQPIPGKIEVLEQFPSDQD